MEYTDMWCTTDIANTSSSTSHPRKKRASNQTDRALTLPQPIEKKEAMGDQQNRSGLSGIIPSFFVFPAQLPSNDGDSDSCERTSDTENPWNFSGAGTNETGGPWSTGLVTANPDPPRGSALPTIDTLRERTSDTENPWNFSGAGTNKTGRPWSSGLVMKFLTSSSI